MLRLGKFTDAIERGDERRSSLRKENATMYSDFISQNPGASVEERMEFANGLIQETGVGTRGLPTKSTMSSKVKTYRDEQDRIATDRAASLERDRLAALRTSMQDSKDIIAAAAQANMTDDEVKKLYEDFNLSPAEGDDGGDAVASRRKAIDKLRFNNWVSEHQELITAYYANPTKGMYDRLYSDGGEFAEQVEDRYKPVYEGTYTQLELDYSAELRDLVLTEGMNKAQFSAALKTLKEKYPADVTGKLTEFTENQVLVRGETVDAEDQEASLRLDQELIAAAANASTDKEAYDIQVQGIKLKYTDAQIKLSTTQILRSEEDKNSRLKTAKTEAQRVFFSNAENELTKLTENGTSQLLFAGQVERFKTEAVAAGFEVPPNFGGIQEGQRLSFEEDEQKKATESFLGNARYRMQSLASQENATQESLTSLTDLLRKEATAGGITLPVDFGIKAQTQFVAADKLRKADNLKDFMTNANGLLDELALDPDTTQDQFDAKLRLMKSQAKNNGLELGETFGDDQATKLKGELDKRADEITVQQQDLIETAVDQSANDVTQAVKDNDNFETVVRDLEDAISRDPNIEGDIKLSPELRATLQKMFDDEVKQLKIDIDAFASGVVAKSDDYNNVLNRSKEQFVANFVLQLEATGQGNIQDAKDRFGEVAEDTFDNIVSTVRAANNDQEVANIQAAVADMNTSRIMPPSKDHQSLLTGLLKVPEIVGGDADAKVVAANTVSIVSAVYSTARAFAEDNNIFLTDRMIEKIGATLVAETQGQHVVGTKFDPKIVQTAVELAFRQEIMGDEGNMPLELEAYFLALEEAKAQSIIGMDEEQKTIFKASYERFRREAAEDRFDIFGATFEGDVSRSDGLQSQSLTVVNGATQKADLIEGKFAEIESLIGDDFINAEDLVAGMTSLVEAQALALPTIRLQIKNAGREISKLTALLRTNVYKKSENRAAVSTRIEELKVSLDGLANAEARIENAKSEINSLNERVAIEVDAFDLREQQTIETNATSARDAELIAARQKAARILVNRTLNDGTIEEWDDRDEQRDAERLTSSENVELERLIKLDEVPEGVDLHQRRWTNGFNVRRKAVTKWLLSQPVE